MRLPLRVWHARFESVSLPDSAVAPSNQTILVVDDEPDVLRLIESILDEEGFEVIQANSAEAAVKAFDKLNRTPDLLLTDVVMPGTSGPMLADQLLQKDPELKVLFMSGYDDRHVVQRYVVEQGFRLISKPFTVKSLRTAIHAAFKPTEKTKG
jgi:DNA-binding NtrC family response regulator